MTPNLPDQTQSSSRGRLLAVGDIHGCDLLLRDLLAAVVPTSEDQLVFLGDYIDRGSGSRQVIDQLLELRRILPQTVFLKGNHEQMLLAYLEGDDSFGYLLNGGSSTLRNYRERGRINMPEAHLEFLSTLRTSYETEQFIFVHAGLRPGRPLEEQSETDLLWIRAEFLNSDYDWGKTLVFGHTPQVEPIIQPKRLGLDTGAVYGRRLTCCNVLTRTFWSAG